MHGRFGIGVLAAAMLGFAPALAQTPPQPAAETAPAPETPSLYGVVERLRAHRFVDLTHAFGPGIPHRAGFQDEERITTHHYDPGIGRDGTGFFAQLFCHPGQWGTHVDPPAHFVRGTRLLDEIPVTEMILPMVVLDAHEQAIADPDYQITMDVVRAWEERHGPVPEGAFVAMRTDWSRRWPDPALMRNADAQGVAHFPGWSREVLAFLYEERRITASGHETTGTDPGIRVSADDYSLAAYVLGQNRYQISLLTNLGEVPEFGAIAVVTFPKPSRGSGFPARVFAIVP